LGNRMVCLEPSLPGCYFAKFPDVSKMNQSQKKKRKDKDKLTQKGPKDPTQDHERNGLLHVVQDRVPTHVVRLLEAGVDVPQVVDPGLQAGDVEALLVG
jgi:hypothetical protein